MRVLPVARPPTADACNQCDHCRRAGPEHNGEPWKYQPWEIDCTQEVDRRFISRIVTEARGGHVPPFIFADEIQRLSERSAQEALLKFVEDLEDGVFLAAVMTDPDDPGGCPPMVLPSLFDRTRSPTTHSESTRIEIDLPFNPSEDFTIRVSPDDFRFAGRLASLCRAASPADGP